MKTETLPIETNMSTWTISALSSAGKGSMYTVDVEHEAGYTPWDMTSDRTVISLYYLEDDSAAAGKDNWEIGIRDMESLLDHEVILQVVVYKKDGVREVVQHDRPKVRDGSGSM